MQPQSSHLVPERPGFPTVFAVVGVSAVGLALRLAGIGQDLWIDELATLSAVRVATLGDLLASYGGANQHTLNSVLVWLGIRMFGEAEWAIRLSAVLFGAATVPVFYWMARLARFTPPWALFGMTLLALSSHHVWFSLNARGYAGYLLFSLLGVGALVRVLETGAVRWIVMFIIVSGLNFLALLPSVFLFGAQVLTVIGLIVSRRADAPSHRLGSVQAAAVALSGAAALAVLIYLPLVREMLDVLGRTAPAQVTAFPMLSVDFLKEILHGLAPGVPPTLFGLAIFPVALGLWGLAGLTQKAPRIVTMLLGGHLLFGTAILILGWPVYPRLFILLLPLGLLTLLGAADRVGRFLEGRSPQLAVRVVGGACAVVLVVFLVLLRPVLAQPKQPYRAALAAAWEMVEPDGDVLVVGVADRGIGHYAGREERWSGRLTYARTLGEFTQAVAGSPAPPILLISTFDAALAAEEPEVWAQMTAHWTRARRISGTVRGGALSLWTPVADSIRVSGVAHEVN